MKVLAALTIGPLLILILGIGGCETVKAYYDWKVTRLCEREGGITVFEHLAVSREQFALLGGSNGLMALPTERARRTDVPAFQGFADPVYLRTGYLSVVRYEGFVARASDSKVLGRAVWFSRAGGDFPFTGDASSHFQCPNGLDLVRAVLVEEGKR